MDDITINGNITFWCVSMCSGRNYISQIGLNFNLSMFNGFMNKGENICIVLQTCRIVLILSLSSVVIGENVGEWNHSNHR